MKETELYRQLILALESMDHETLMEILYDAVISSSDDIINYNESTEVKIEKLNYMLMYFEELEEFEKCAKIKAIQNRLSN